MTPDDFVQLVERIVPEVQRKPVLDTVQFRVGAKAFDPGLAFGGLGGC